MNFLQPIQTFDQYLGQGSFGIVLKATDVLQQSTAVKFIFPVGSTIETNRAKDLNHHENLVKVLNLVEKKFTEEELLELFKILPENVTSSQQCINYLGRVKICHEIAAVCIQQELCGENLRKWLGQTFNKSDPSLNKHQLTIIKDITNGLKHLHDNNIIHRNLKPENVLFSESCNPPVKIADYDQCGTITQTDYTAPELIRLEQYSFQSDLYSLGLIIWEVVQLIEPLERTSLFFELVQNDEVSIIQEHPSMEGFKELIIGMTKRQTKDRIKDINHVFHVISSWGTENFLTAIKSYPTCLGHGSFGIVLKAIDQSNSATAVKFMFPMEAPEKERQQMIRECKITRCIRHLNIVKVIAVEERKFTAGELEGIFSDGILTNQQQSLKDMYIGQARRYKTAESVCVQMELCGGTLRRWLGQVDKNDASVQRMQVEIVRNIVEGLRHLHNEGIIHRDLKPENIMFSRDFECPVKIGDFGLCRKIHSEASQTGTLTSRMGTVDYMAPEAFRNNYSLQADLYSLGLVIWEVVQLIPFQDRKATFDGLVSGLEEALVTGHPLMPGISELIVRLTKKGVEDRLQSIGEVTIVYSISQELPPKNNANKVKGVVQRESLDLTGIFTARNGEELRDCLEKVTSGGFIKLVKGDYAGEFTLSQDNVRICGVDGTVFKGSNSKTSCLTIVGDRCSIFNVAIIVDSKDIIGIKLTGSENEINSVRFTGGRPSFVVTGDENKIRNLTISNALNGIELRGCKNTVDAIEMRTVEYYGISIEENSNENTISNITGNNVTYGIHVSSSYTNVSNVTLTKNRAQWKFQGVLLNHGSDNSNIQNLICFGYRNIKDDYGLCIHSNICSVENSECGPILVEGNKAKLTNVQFGDVIRVEGDDVTLMKCGGICLESTKIAKVIECNIDNFPITILNMNNNVPIPLIGLGDEK